MDALLSRYLSAGPWAFAGELYLSMVAGASRVGVSLFLGLVADPSKPAIRIPPRTVYQDRRSETTDSLRPVSCFREVFSEVFFRPKNFSEEGVFLRMSRTFSTSQTSERNLSEAAFSASEKLFLNSVIRLSDDCVARVAHALASQLAILRILAKKTCFPAGDGHIHPSFGDGLAISLYIAKLSGYWHKATINQLGARRSNISNEGL